jgi:AraC-like DNA-binding protein
MNEFYKRALWAGLWLLVASLILGYTCLQLSYLRVSLLPAGKSPFLWKSALSWEVSPDGPSRLQIHEDRQRLRFDFSLGPSTTAAPTTAAIDLRFHDTKGKPVDVDLSRYSSISLVVRCSPSNTLNLSILTLEEQVRRPENHIRYRVPGGHFYCTEEESLAELDLTRLETPFWWYEMSRLNLSHHAYKLNKVPKLVLGSTIQSPVGVKSSVEISEIVLHGRDRRYLLLLAVVLLLGWGSFGVWFTLRYARAMIEDVKGKLQKDLPFVAYQQLSLKPHRDKEKTTILQFLATNYADPELDLDRVVQQTGVNRNKINDVLKAELGFTFSGYLNKLRLTESARLLAEQDSATIQEIAFSVGYGNVSYFNRLFKEEYGSTPKAFRSACKP